MEVFGGVFAGWTAAYALGRDALFGGGHLEAFTLICSRHLPSFAVWTETYAVR